MFFIRYFLKLSAFFYMFIGRFVVKFTSKIIGGGLWGLFSLTLGVFFYAVTPTSRINQYISIFNEHNSFLSPWSFYLVSAAIIWHARFPLPLMIGLINYASQKFGFGSLFDIDNVSRQSELILYFTSCYIWLSYRLFFARHKIPLLTFFKVKNKNRFFKELDNLAMIYSRCPSKAGYEFEKFIRDIYKAKGHDSVLSTDLKRIGRYPKEFLGVPGDGGFDVQVRLPNEILLVQTKYKGGENKVKGDDVAKTHTAAKIFRDYYRSIGFTGFITPVLITNGQVDSTGDVYEKKTDVEVISGNDFFNFVKQAA